MMSPSRRKYIVRAGGAERIGVGLVVAAGFAVIMIAVGTLVLIAPSWSSATPPSPGGPGVDESPGSETGGGPADRASTETIERVLESVQVYVAREEFKPAIAILQRAVGEHPEDPDLRYALGDLHMRVEAWSSAYDQYAAGIAAEDTPGAETLFTAGTLASEIGSYELSETHYEAAMAADPENPEYPLYLANIRLKLNKLDEAAAAVALAGRLAPERSEVWVTWAHIAMRRNAIDAALDHIAHARELEPAVPEWARIEARLLKRRGAPAAAIEVLSALGETAQTTPATARLLAESYGMLDRPGAGAERVVASARAHPEDPSIAYDAAVWLERAGERGRALDWARRARELGHERAGAWIDSLQDRP